MCLSPKRILNRSNHWNAGKPLYLTVPCGKCEECKRSSRSDWFVRCYYEWQHSAQTFFYTLTYNSEHLPVFHCDVDVPCFSKRDIQLFLKRLRFLLSKHGVKLRYMICSEFGLLRHRPHYHPLFFLDKVISPYLFYKMVQDAWPNGFVKYGDNFGVVNSSSGISYVTKYITKDESHTDSYFPIIQKAVYRRYSKLYNYIINRWPQYNQLVFIAPFVDGFKFNIKDLNGNKIEKDDIRFPFVSAFLSKINSLVSSRLPFHLQSTKLGVHNLEGKLSLDDLLSESVTLNTNGDFRSYKFPRYFKRLFWYDKIENEVDGKKTIYQLNQQGIRHILERDSLLLEQKECELSSTLHNIHQITDDLATLVSSSTGTLFKTKYDLIYWLQNMDLDLKVMSIYSIYFRDRVNFGVKALNKETVLDSYLDYAEYCLTNSFKYDYGKIYERFCGRQKFDIFHFATWNNHPFFYPYEQALQILETCSLANRIAKAKAQKELEENQRKLRELINNCFT